MLHLHRAFEDRERWILQGRKVPQIAIDLSASRLEDKSFIKRVRDNKTVVVGQQL
jgi:hypothetical protein